MFCFYLFRIICITNTFAYSKVDCNNSLSPVSRIYIESRTDKVFFYQHWHHFIYSYKFYRDEFLNYCYLLKRYLYINSNGDKCKAKSSYIVLMHRLEELYYLAEDIVRIYLDMDPENAGPLFVELFDLKWALFSASNNCIDENTSLLCNLASNHTFNGFYYFTTF